MSFHLKKCLKLEGVTMAQSDSFYSGKWYQSIQTKVHILIMGGANSACIDNIPLLTRVLVLVFFKHTNSAYFTTVIQWCGEATAYFMCKKEGR